MIKLNSLSNTHRRESKVQRVGRGPGSKRGKTCGRGHKGDGSRSGYKRRFGYEGGRMRLFMRLPIRGFTRGRFKNPRVALNLSMLDKWFSDGEKVNLQTLQEKGYISKEAKEQLRILSQGELHKKVTIEAHYLSPKAIEKLNAAKISYTILES